MHSNQSNLATIKKIGRHHHVVVNDRSVGKRRSEKLALRFVIRLYFKPVIKYLGQLDGSIGTSIGFGWFNEYSVHPGDVTSRGEDLKRWTLAHNPFVIYVDRFSVPWLESLWEEVALRQSNSKFWSTPLDWEKTF